jgi:hypothetical protein
MSSAPCAPITADETDNPRSRGLYLRSYLLYFLSRYTAIIAVITDDMQKINNSAFDKSELIKFIRGLKISRIRKVMNINDNMIDICGKILTNLFIITLHAAVFQQLKKPERTRSEHHKCEFMLLNSHCEHSQFFQKRIVLTILFVKMLFLHTNPRLPTFAA